MNMREKADQILNQRIAAERSPSEFHGVSARQRLSMLFDPGTFVEVGAMVRQRPTELGSVNAREGVVTGYGAVNGALVFAFAQDAAILKGAITEMQAEKICNLIHLALKADAPLVSYIDSCGMHLTEGADALEGYGKILALCSELQGQIPHVCVINGICAGALSFLPAYADYAVMVKDSELFLTVPDPTNKNLDAKTLPAKEGLVSRICETDRQAAEAVKEFFHFFSPADTRDSADRQTADIAKIIEPEVYDMKEVIAQIADKGEFLEFAAAHAANLITGLIHLDGMPCGVIANQPNFKAGELTAPACVKGAKFLSFCDNFGLPVVTLTDTAGFAANATGIADSALLLSAYAAANTVKITLIVGKAYGAGYLSMGTKASGADLVLAYPTAQIAPLPPAPGAILTNMEKIRTSDTPAEERKRLMEEYKDTVATPLQPAFRGYVDDIIPYAVTRQMIVSSLNLFREADE